MRSVQVDGFMQWALPISKSLSFMFLACSHVAVDTSGVLLHLSAWPSESCNSNSLSYLLTEQQSEQSDFDEGSIFSWFLPSEDKILIWRKCQGCFNMASPLLPLLHFLSITIYWVYSCQICLLRTKYITEIV